MKKLLIFLMLLVPIISYGQEQKDFKLSEEAEITEQVIKIEKAINKLIKFVKSEVQQFKDEAVENMAPEELQQIYEAKKNIKYEIKYIHDAIHQGWKQGWRGEEYSPPYKHK